MFGVYASLSHFFGSSPSPDPVPAAMTAAAEDDLEQSPPKFFPASHQVMTKEIIPPQCHAEVTAFREYIDYGLGDHRHKGLDGNGEQKDFVCTQALEKYWTVKKISAVLRRDNNHEVNAEEVRKNYLKIFSILVYIAYSAFIHQIMSNDEIDDTTLIHSQRVAGKYPELDKILPTFSKAQWKFNPYFLDGVRHGRKLDMERILPLSLGAPLTGTEMNEVVAYKASLYPCCIGDAFRESAKAHDVVLKMFGAPKHDMWKEEAENYNHIHNNWGDETIKEQVRKGQTSKVSPWNYITTYLGSFQHLQRQGPSKHQDWEPPGTSTGIAPGKRTHGIILEYAKGGDLANFCQDYLDSIMSSKREDRLKLWFQLFYLLEALDGIHNIEG